MPPWLGHTIKFREIAPCFNPPSGSKQLAEVSFEERVHGATEDRDGVERILPHTADRHQQRSTKVRLIRLQFVARLKLLTRNAS
jgi:hypothetical protein